MTENKYKSESQRRRCRSKHNVISDVKKHGLDETNRWQQETLVTI